MAAHFPSLHQRKRQATRRSADGRDLLYINGGHAYNFFQAHSSDVFLSFSSEVGCAELRLVAHECG